MSSPNAAEDVVVVMLHILFIPLITIPLCAESVPIAKAERAVPEDDNANRLFG